MPKQRAKVRPVDRMPTARLRIRRRVLPLHDALPTIRWVAVTTLIVCLVVGGLRFVFRPLSVGALEFTLHREGDNDAIGVQGITVGDIDGDGDQDIVTAGGDGIKVYENEGDFEFQVHIIDGAKGERVQIADFNDDGRNDILATIKQGSARVRWYRQEDEDDLDFSTHTLISSGDDPVAYAGDIDGDGYDDIVTSMLVGDARVLSRWINNGNSTFTETVLDADSGVTALTVGNTDDVAYPEIVTGGSGGLQRWRTGDGVTWARDDIDDENQNATHLVVESASESSVFIVTADSAEDMVAVYRSREHWLYGRRELGGDAIDAKTVFPVDFDNDGFLDVLATGQDDNRVMWYRNDGQDSFTQETLVSNLQSVYAVAAADFDGDGDMDFVTADHFRGPLSVYERIRVKPEAANVGSVEQTTNGSGVLTFKATISDGDFDPTRIRVQYSLDGVGWDKPWLTKVTADNGTVDLKNSNGFQVGTSNPIDTNDHEAVQLTFTWDTKSVQNTGGSLNGREITARVRVLPRDDKNTGTATSSSSFTIDNRGPQGLANLRITDISADQATLEWTPAQDTSLFTYKVYYGTDATSVLEQTSEAWEGSDDDGLNDVEATTTTITGLEADKTYTFKLVATDSFGNSTAVPHVRGVTSSAAASPAPGATPSPTTTPFFLPSPTPTTSPSLVSPSPTISPASPVPSPVFTPTPSPTPSPELPPPTDVGNQPPTADAGPDQLVNPSALVILDATASSDRDRDSLLYSWRQIDGPQVELISDRTATPSFSAGGENETYIFAVTVRDSNGASATDQVTVATRSLPETDTTATATVQPGPTDVAPAEPAVSPLVSSLLHPADLLLFVLSVLSTLLLVVERVLHALGGGGRKTGDVVSALPTDAQAQGRVLHYRTGEPIAGAHVLVYGQDGKLRTSLRTNKQGVFPTFFPAGQYTLGVQASGFTFAPTAARGMASPGSIVYTGGALTVRTPNQPLSITVPMKPTAAEVGSWKIRLLHVWQATQHLGRILSWPIFLTGALLNTALVFIAPRPLYLVLEVVYIFLVITKIALEVRIRPAYGQVRDAITHVPLDLAVVRLLEQGTNRLIMTRVTNNQGKFFALPPAGRYTITVSKPGYATFSKQDVEIKSEHDTTLQMTADLMPVAPQPGGLAQARAAVL